MSDRTRHAVARPVFKKCPRCGYSLRGLPGDHACPECCLRFDARCELYRVINPKRLVGVWIAMIVSGWVVLSNLPHLANFGAATLWEKLCAVVAVLWFPSVAYGIWFIVERYRRGFGVAVTSDGLIVRLMMSSEELIPWDNIGDASVRAIPKRKNRIVRVLLKDKWIQMNIGGVANVFPTTADAERFVGQVKSRIASASGEGVA